MAIETTRATHSFARRGSRLPARRSPTSSGMPAMRLPHRVFMSVTRAGRHFCVACAGTGLRSASDAALDAAIRAYWDERIHDIELSADPPGSAAFYAALDAYRLRKNRYLLESVGFDRWAGSEVLEIGCGAGLDLVRFARHGARVSGIDV